MTETLMHVEDGDRSDRNKVGLVGAGAWGQRAYVPALTRLQGAALVAVADRDRARAEDVARQTGGLSVFGSIEAMLAGAALDIVCVATPDDCHVADAGVAVEAGIAILCEKPLAVSVQDARDLEARARTRNLPTRVGFTMRYAPAVRRLKEWVAGGAIGEPRLLQAFQQNGQFLDPDRPFHWKMDAARTGGGAIVEYGVHTIDLARWIMGEVERVASAAQTAIPTRPEESGLGRVAVTGDDSTAWLMSFASGALGVCHAGWATPGRPPGLELRVYGSSGAVCCLLQNDLPGDEAFWLAGADGSFAPVEVPLPKGALPRDAGPWWLRWTAHLLGSFVAEVGGAPPDVNAPTFEDGLRAQEILDAVVVASRERRWVDVARR